MSPFNTILNIAVVFDNNFVKHFYVLATSIFKNNKESAVHFHAIAIGISEKEKEDITWFTKQNRSDISFLELTGEQKRMVIMPNVETRYTIINFYRLFFPIILRDKIQKFLYLDTDIVVIGSLKELFDMSLDGKPFGAVLDPGDEIRTDLGIRENDAYFNAGVMLVDIPTWIKRKTTERALTFLNEFPERCKYLDQDILNAVSIGDWKIIGSKFNLLEQYVPNLKNSEYKKFLRGKVIIHFNRIKPWDPLCASKIRYIYYEYFKASPVSSSKMYNKFSFTFRNLYLFLRFRIEGNYYYRGVKEFIRQ